MTIHVFIKRFIKYLFSLYYDMWSNKLSTVCFNSIQLSFLFEGHWSECGIVFFVKIIVSCSPSFNYFCQCFCIKFKNIFVTFLHNLWKLVTFNPLLFWIAPGLISCIFIWNTIITFFQSMWYTFCKALQSL